MQGYDWGSWPAVVVVDHFYFATIKIDNARVAWIAAKKKKIKKERKKEKKRKRHTLHSSQISMHTVITYGLRYLFPGIGSIVAKTT